MSSLPPTNPGRFNQCQSFHKGLHKPLNRLTGARAPVLATPPTLPTPCRSHAWQAACRQLGIKAKRTRPYRSQTNGKIERFHRTLADGWAYARHYTSETQRRQALPAWLHLYNHHRPHPPITRLTNLPDQYN